MTYLDSAHLLANCAGPGEPVRAMASRVWHGQAVPIEAVVTAARAAASGMTCRVGRVEYSGTFEEPAFTTLIGQALPAPLSEFLRPKTEWYACRGAFFHNDAHYDGVLFGVWCILGPARELVFPRTGARVLVAVGHLAVFDPFEPHAVLGPGAETYQSEDYETADVSVFLGFEVTLAPPVRATFGISEPHPGAPSYSSRVAIHPVTGVAATAGA